jgi:2-keto-4-pentenoate hydratase/2-oxohepta-3-ene-1,7-dioic acid hydratase in catechol pathway
VKLVLFHLPNEAAPRPGLLTDRGVVSIAGAVKAGHDAQSTMVNIIDGFEALRPALADLAAKGEALPLSAVRLRAPLPRPGKILCCIGNYWEHQEREARAPNMFLKSSDAVIGPGDTVVLPDHTEPYVFQHEAELAIVIKGPAKSVPRADWRKAVFGYTCMIDVSGRGEGRLTWKRGSWMGKSFDTFGPLGPCIATADEIPDPNKLHVQFWDNGQLRHDYTTDDMENQVPVLIEWATKIMTLKSGDVLACGTNHEGLGPLQDGDEAVIEIERIGRMTVNVADPLKRTWERGVYMGPNSTNPEAVRRAREAEAKSKP